MNVKFFVLFITISWHLTVACTIFSLQDGDRVFVGKNFDWPIDDGLICLNPSGIQKSGLRQEGSDAIRWVSTYGSISFNQFGLEFPLGGMNEAGLVIEEASYSLSRYPDWNSVATLNEFQWIQYCLDTKATVPELIRSLSEIGIKPLFIRLHYFVCDLFGACVIIEFIDGELKIYSGESLPKPVLTNNSYENSLDYLRRHAGYGGNLPIRTGPESPVRFVRTTVLLDSLVNEKTIDRSDVFSILESVKQNDTQWQIVYDPGTMSVHYRTHNILQQQICLSDWNYKIEQPMIKKLGMSGPFREFTSDFSIAYLNEVFGQYVSLGELSVTESDEFQLHFSDYILNLYKSK
ncbi:MAG: linear amide C-N hydrolase [Candidatus Marinimicrobia bacterium]|nr:linear amide C-N hydrolase [Candidatus Neomarinimicrobiota bacterium]